MKFTVNWLKRYVDFELPMDKLAERLTMLGLEVDAVTPLYESLAAIKVAQVVSVSPHPNADRLSLCDVRVGEAQVRLVCGAPNVRAGLVTAIALPGVTMPEGFKIKKSRIRGEVSEGMLCSERELGLNDSHTGIIELPDSCRDGEALTSALGLDDTLIEIDLTPNRPDCASVIGIAREVAGFTGARLKLPEVNDTKEQPAPFSVEVLDAEACPRYAARLLKNVRIGPSPDWLRRLLETVGLRSVNNIVDVTNFVMLECGQPLHAFDFNKLAGGKIVVRRAKDGEKISTLDDVERDLSPDMLVICDAEKPAAVAGVMGGKDSEVDEQTTDVLLESAYFNPVCIRRTARNLKLPSEASYRFERGIDPQGTIFALNRAMELMIKLSGAEASGGLVDCGAGVPAPAPINLRVGRTCRLLGDDFSLADISAYLNAIEVRAEKVDADTLRVTPPSFRVDLEREVDLVEEIARLRGYNEIPTSLPTVPMTFSGQDEGRILRQQLLAIMAARGYSEAINYSFTDGRYFDKLNLAADDPLRRHVAILNPLTEEQGIMRTTLLPGLLENARHNLNRQNNDLGLFELGKVFWPQDDGRQQPRESYRLAAVFCGRRYGGSPVHLGAEAVDLYDLKGCIEVIGRELRLEDMSFAAGTDCPPYAVQGQFMTVMAGDEPVGAMGRFNKPVMREFGIKQDVYFLDMDIDALAAARRRKIRFEPLSRFPSVHWDLAVIVANDIGAGEIAMAIENGGFKFLKGVDIFDVYSGQPIPAGRKSVALSITYHSDTATLSDKAVNRIHKKVIAFVLNKFSGQLREA
jgi:phenylalanyl-tRNA synthetase beta chain